MMALMTSLMMGQCCSSSVHYELKVCTKVITTAFIQVPKLSATLLTASYWGWARGPAGCWTRRPAGWTSRPAVRCIITQPTG